MEQQSLCLPYFSQCCRSKNKPETNFLPTADDLRPHLDGAVLLALCSPLNPTGTMFTKEQLSEICELVIAENKKEEQTKNRYT
jgi:aspartate aminotransferase